MLNRLIRFSLVSAFALALAGHGVAMADSHEKGDGDTTEEPTAEPTEDGDANKEDGDAKNPCADGAKNPCADAPAADAGAGRQGKWDARANERARTNPASVISAGVNIAAVAKFEVFGAQLFGRYGISDMLDVGLTYGMALEPSEFKGPLGVQARYNAISNADMDVTAYAGIGYDLLGEAIAPLQLGAVADKLLMDRKLNVSGRAAFSVALDGDPKPITLGASVGAMYQLSGTAKSAMSVGATIPLVDLSISNSTTTVIGADFFVVSGVFMWSNRMIDVGVSVGTDLKNSPGDAIVAGLFLGYNMGGNTK